ncbi:hypothetical protein EG68_03601 [Paragonimus skrjabini miyazakii]|uniref:CDK5 regulatory subunit-associated protein 3 n=1 Tax=Paragonimus skrjabini miyazakii TaxID=59628 RepID=A0A8S9YZK9_9TREM|nr:hypothetical protein EG68_03601 [Paragonimus skrjabini miyazakii]
MTHQNLLAQPICIQSSKLIEWLLNRKLLLKDYPKRLLAVVKKLSQLINGNDSFVSSDPNLKPREFCFFCFTVALVSYLNALQLVEKIEKEDKTTDFFGRASQNVRAWRDIIESYEKSNLHLGKIRLTLLTIQAEIGEQIQEIAADLRQKIKEHTLNLMQKEDALEKFCREFQLEVKEENVKLKLLEKAADIPDHLSHFVVGLKDLKPALDLYETVANCIHKCSRNSGRQEAVSEANLCHTLALLITSGHVRLFTWLTNREPEKIEADDDFIPGLLLEEQNIFKHKMSMQYLPNGETVTAVTPEDIVWDDTEEADKIDFDTLDLADDEPIEIEVVDNTTDLEQITDGSAVNDKTDAVHVAESNVASGKTARLLLDTAQGRIALLNDLVELGAFLGRFTEDQMELQGCGGGAGEVMDTSKRIAAGTSGGSITLQSMILQNAPSAVHSMSAKESSQLLTLVEQARAQLTNSSMSQLLMIRNKPGYLDRLIGRMTDLKNQVTRVKSRMLDAQLQIDEACSEQEHQAAALVQYRTQCKQLVSFMEKELTRICNRKIQIIGQVLDL